MKKTIPILLIFLLCLACQEEQTEQYFEDSPEIEICKKAVQAYMDQDWVSFKLYYSDTARLWRNTYYDVDPGVSVSEIIEAYKKGLQTFDYFGYVDDPLWEMVINSEGDKWVHFWGRWIGKLSGATDETKLLIHIDYKVKDGKIVSEVGFWDNLPLYLARKELEMSKED